MCFSKNFIVLALTFRFMMYFELIFVYSGEGILHSFACEYPVVFVPLLKRLIFSPLNGCDTLVENQLTINVKVYFGLSVLFHWFVCLALCQYHNI